eukprot:CAMPEP_0114599592 /NCGR_PEP_ID=MMETSP0125-20121206/22106_1 /TAXON_ID=485358 ORGANISM="Aristerostoma sp., Strain ATCC 50986" /NCGR_SAMPLE_ID=MMETSP0125 /ASSEMBLY_ACC=CAM_ASM_000245 /LENGTH=314 /DNA_ID=CAMNT_0001806765 /DNA_START=102 /DNA_END=1047 /DNA_ORIENTATION=-
MVSETPSLENLELVRVLSRSRYPILLVKDSLSSNLFVTKLYPHLKGGISHGFLNETNLLDLSHPNIIEAVSSHRQLKLDCVPQLSNVSGLLLNYASKGDLCELLFSSKTALTDGAIRTIFGQILDGLNYLHNQGKPTIFLNENYQVKIADFDQSVIIDDGAPSSKGTPGYRAPEVLNGNCENPVAADIFSLGVILFNLKSRVPPYAEGKLFKGKDLYDELIKDDNSEFWKIHEKAQNDDIFFSESFKSLIKRMLAPNPQDRPTFFSESFKSLIKRMLAPNPQDRPTLAEIKKSEWFSQTEMLTQDGLAEELSML